METAASALEVAKSIWDTVSEHISYISNPSKKRKLLNDELVKLTYIRDDIKERVEREEIVKRGKRLRQVDGWLRKVDQTRAKCHRVLETLWSLGSSYGHGKEIAQLCGDVQTLQSEGKFEEVVAPLPRQVCEIPTERTVGMDSMLSQVWEWLGATDVGIIGLYGLGGAGKTTLLKKINNRFISTTWGFKFVLWIVASKQVNLDRIRDSIRKDLEIGDDVWNSLSEDSARARELYRVLNKERFVLLMDDIWERVDVTKIGIPIPNPENRSKIVFTTRSEELCGKMEAKKRLKVECLSSEQALELFEEKVGQDTLNSHPDIRKHAEDVVKECKGLPLALITIGRAMATKKSRREWEHALKVLRSRPSEFSEMEVEVYELLEFSYRSLKSPTLRQCFLYCALFPEDCCICNDHLIDLWICEGFLVDANDTYAARLEGESVIGSLKSACLLEEGTDDERLPSEGRSECSVKLHDVIRDMALWIAREHGKEGNKIIVEEEDVHMSRWKQAERVSLQGKRIKIDRFKELLECSRLVTLRINDTKLETLPEGFFNSMPVLKVLNMSGNSRLKKLPASVGGLVKLQYLNLSFTSIKVLPVEMKYLTSLQYLLLECTNGLINIPNEVISSLLSLKVYRMCEVSEYFDERGLLEGLEGLDQLDELSIQVKTDFGVQKMLESPNLLRIITYLNIYKASDLTAIQIPARKVSHLNTLEIVSGSLESIEICEGIPRHVDDRLSRGSELRNLHNVMIFECDKLRNLSWLIYAPNLQALDVQKCNTLEKIIDEEILRHVDENASARLFSSLTVLLLCILPKLRSIHNRTLSFSSLEDICISGCPSLKKLPFDSNSGRNSLREVGAEDEWWSGLEWEDEAAKDFFTSKLVNRRRA